MATKVIRVTMFKIPSVENQHKFIELYKTLSATAVKVTTSNARAVSSTFVVDPPSPEHTSEQR